MLRLSNGNASVTQGLIAPKDCLKALLSWKFENKPPEGEEEGEEKH